MSVPREEGIEVRGELLGVRRAAHRGAGVADVVRITAEQRPSGPAENALVLVERLDGATLRARYISWIGYYDIEEAKLEEPAAWDLVEPSREYRERVEWVPFGWEGMSALPNHGPHQTVHHWGCGRCGPTAAAFDSSNRGARIMSHFRNLALTVALAGMFACASPPGPSAPAAASPQASVSGPTVRIAVAQLDAAHAGDFTMMDHIVELASGSGARLIIFPEGSVQGWLNPAAFTDADPIPGPTASWFQQTALSYGVWIAVGLAEQGPAAGTGPGVHEAYDSGILVNPLGQIVLHHRKYDVLLDAFDPTACTQDFGTPNCNYTPGSLSDLTVVATPFGQRTSLIVCADAYTYNTAVLDQLKALNTDTVIVVWGVGAGNIAQCGTNGFNATGFASTAASYLGTATVVGANATGQRTYGKYLPSWYCGTSGFALPGGAIGGVANTTDLIVFFDIPAP